MIDITTYLSRVTQEHADKPNFIKFITALLQPFIDAQGLFVDLITTFDIDTAVGVQLDAVGQWVGRSRDIITPFSGIYFSFDTLGLGFDEGSWQGQFNPTTGITKLDDETYRQLLKAKVIMNHWDGTIEMAALALAELFGPFVGTLISIQDNQDMTMTVALGGQSPPGILLSLLQGGYVPIKPEGVLINYGVTSVNQTALFGFDTENLSIKGFDEGAWSGVQGVASGPVSGFGNTGVTNNSASFAWIAPTIGTGPFTYQLQYSQGSVMGPVPILAGGPTPNTIATVGGLQAQTPYTFQVYPINGVGNGPVSGPVTITTLGGVPGQVTGLVATGSGQNSINLSWNNVPGANTVYQVQFRQTGSGNQFVNFNGTTNQLTISVTGLLTSTNYDFQVFAQNPVGVGPTSVVITAGTAGVGPGVVNNLAVTTIGSTDVALTWNQPITNNGPYAYTVQFAQNISPFVFQNFTGQVNITGTGGNADITGLQSSQAYVFTVFATNTGGNGPTATPVPATTTAAAAGTPASLTPSNITATSVVLSWPATTGAVTYQLQRALGTGAFSDVGAATALLTETVTGLTSGTAYRFQVCGISGTGVRGAFSPIASIVTSGVVPGIPTAFLVTAIADNSVSFSWGAPTTGTPPFTYQLQFALSGGSFSNFGTPVSTLTGTVSSLNAGTDYLFRVFAVNSFGPGAPTASDPATTTGGGTPATVPPGQTLSVINGVTTDSSVVLFWVAPSIGDPVVHYQTQYRKTGTSLWYNGPLLGVQTTTTILDLIPSTQYDFQVIASNAGGSGPPSTLHNASTLTSPVNPLLAFRGVNIRGADLTTINSLPTAFPHINSVVIPVYCSTASQIGTDVILTVTAATIGGWIDAAVAAGLKVFLAVYVFPRDGSPMQTITPGNSVAGTATFFNNLQTICVQVAQLGTAHGATGMFCGVELQPWGGTASGDTGPFNATHNAQWISIYTACKAAWPTGTIAYAALQTSLGITTPVSSSVVDWSIWDAVVIDLYPGSNNSFTTTTAFQNFFDNNVDPDPSTQSVTGQVPLFQAIQNYSNFIGQKVYINQCGIVPADGNQTAPGRLNATPPPFDFPMQSAWWQAVMAELSDMTDNVAGFFAWDGGVNNFNSPFNGINYWGIQTTPSQAVVDNFFAGLTGVAQTLAAPTGLQATAETINSISVKWNAIVGSNISYTVQYSVHGANTFTSVLATGLTQTITGLVAQTSYDIRVFATQGQAIGPNSAILTVSTLSGTQSITITNPGTVTAGSAFTVTGVLTGFTTAPTLLYIDDISLPAVPNITETETTTSITINWGGVAPITPLGLPAGAVVTTTSFSFTHPALQPGSHTLRVSTGSLSSSITYSAVSPVGVVSGVQETSATSSSITITWTAPGSVAGSNLVLNGFTVDLVDPTGWPTSATGLPPGAVWNNQLAVNIVPGHTPNPSAPQVIWPNITSALLLSGGAGDIQLSPGTPGSNVLFNQSGVLTLTPAAPVFTLDDMVLGDLNGPSVIL